MGEKNNGKQRMINEFIKNRNIIVKELISFCFNNPPQNAFSIFLCGGAGKESSLFRFSLGKAIEDTQRQDSIFSVYYPETLFSEFLYGSSKRNLLFLEEILADNVSSIVLPLQSPGTYAELGAFASNARLRPKLIVINSKKYSRVRSFINDGPIAYLDKGNVIFDDMKPDKKSIDELKYKIREKTKRIEKEGKKTKTLFDIRFVLCVLIYVFDPISKTDLREYVVSANALTSNEISLLDSATTTADIPSKIKNTLERIRDSFSLDAGKIKEVFFFVLGNESIDSVKNFDGENQIGKIAFSAEANLLSTERILNRAQSDVKFLHSLYSALHDEFSLIPQIAQKLDEKILRSKDLIDDSISYLINDEYEIDRSKIIRR